MRSRSMLHTISACTLILFSGTTNAQQTVDQALGAISAEFDLPEGVYAVLYSVGDFDKDGDRDLLMVDVFNETSWIMAGNSSGGFDPIGPFILDSATSIVAGQFDADPEPEIAFRDPGFSYYISSEPNVIPVEYEDSDIWYFGDIDNDDAFAAIIRSADFDGDGLDEIVLNTSDDRVYIRWSSTGVATPITLDGLGEDNTLYEPADYDGDGDLDLLLLSKDTARFWLIEGTGMGSMGISREIQREYPRIVLDDRPVFGQFDENPAIDMIVIDSGSEQMHLEYNFLVGAFHSEPISTDEFTIPIALVGDLDDSGEEDLVVMRRGQYATSATPDFIAAVLYDVAGSNPTLMDLDVGAPQRGIPYYQGSLFYGSPQTSVTAFDLDRDGDNDLLWHGIAPPSARGVWAIENRFGIDGIPGIGMPSFDAQEGTLNILAIDTDADGFDEMIISGSNNMRVLDLQDGSLGRVTASNNAFMVVAADLDGDGSPEIVNSDNGIQRLRVWTVLADGSVGNRQVFITDGRGPYLGLEVADFNNDGLDDIAAMENNGSVDIYLGGVGPSLTLWAAVDATEPSGNKQGIIDYNNDGLPDLAIGSDEYPGVELYANNGDGTFAAGPVLQSPEIDSSPYWIATGDIDLDGIDDIAFSDNFDLKTYVLFLNADGTLDETRVIMAGQVVEVFIDDLTGDGLPDLAVAASAGGAAVNQPGVIPQRSPREFGNLVMVPGYNSQSVALSDLNHDGAMDMVSIHGDERKLRAYFGTPNLCPADLNHDGSLDFFDVSTLLVDQTDYNNDGSFDFFDVSAFLIDFKTGCS